MFDAAKMSILQRADLVQGRGAWGWNLQQEGGRIEVGKYNKKPEKQKLSEHPRFCRVCRRQTKSWACCGQKTSRVNMTSTIRDKMMVKT